MPLTPEQKALLAALEAEQNKRTSGIKSDDVIFNTSTASGAKVYRQYKKIEESLNDPGVQQALYNRTIAAINKKENKGGKATLSEEKLKAMSPAELKDAFLQMQRRNLGLIAHGIDASTLGNNPDLDSHTNKNFIKAFGDIGADVPTRIDAELAQASYIGWNDLIKDRDDGKIVDPNLTSKLTKFKKLNPLGAGDDPGVGGNKRISRVDGIYTNTTAGEVINVEDDDPAVAATDTPDAETDVVADATNIIKPNIPKKKSPWWLQDMIGLAGSVGDFARVKKYTPWQATPDYVLPEPTFYDPNRELAASAERANAMTEGLAQFSGPQALSSRASQIQGTAATQAADILGRYNNMNVGVANQFESERTNIQNQASREKAGLATQLYDKNTIMNQQFDNAKNQARQGMRDMLRTAITNRAYTSNLNQMYPQFNIDPGSGGFMNYTGTPAPIKATAPNADAIQKFKELKTSLPVGTTDAVIWNMAKSYAGVPDATADKTAEMQAMMSGMPQ